jgi:hypothetical protein
MIDPNKKYTTRDGRDVVIYAVYPDIKWGVHGAIKNRDGTYAMEDWTHAGTYAINGATTDCDLIEVKEPPKELTGWLNIFNDGDAVLFDSFEGASLFGESNGIIARKRITIQYREGEFDK